ncbi:MAG: hypothetical protein ABI318_13965, partial [Chthoniobacteraceae bacterium]
ENGKHSTLSRDEIEQQVSEIIAAVKKLEDLDDAVKKLDDLMAEQRKAGHSISDVTAIMDVKHIRNFHREIVSGMATTLDLSITASKMRDENIGRLRDMAIRFAVPRLLGMKADKGMNEDESLAVFIRRTVADAIERRDWTLLARAIDLNQRLASGQGPLNSTDTSALQQFLAAQNQERARQYAAAVVSYLASLKTGSQSIPAEFVGEQLATIEKEHPKEYQAGIELANNPPPVRYTVTSGPPRTVFSGSGTPSSSIKATLPVQAGPPASVLKSAAEPTPATSPKKDEPKPATPKPVEPTPPK